MCFSIPAGLQHTFLDHYTEITALAYSLLRLTVPMLATAFQKVYSTPLTCGYNIKVQLRSGLSQAPPCPPKTLHLPAYLLGSLFFILLLLTFYLLCGVFYEPSHNFKLCLSNIIKSTSTVPNLPLDKSFYKLV